MIQIWPGVDVAVETVVLGRVPGHRGLFNTSCSSSLRAQSSYKPVMIQDVLVSTASLGLITAPK